MNDIDARLAARLAQIEPPADFDARFAARLAAEQQREARIDRAAELQRALQAHARHQALRRRELRRALIRWAALGVAGLVAVAASVSWWRQFARGVASGMTAADEPLVLALMLGAPLLIGLAAALRPRGFVRALVKR
jgi:negative regulator of sigma E activity